MREGQHCDNIDRPVQGLPATLHQALRGVVAGHGQRQQKDERQPSRQHRDPRGLLDDALHGLANDIRPGVEHGVDEGDYAQLTAACQQPARLRWAGQGRELAWGTAWNLPPLSQLALPLMLEMEAMRRENRTGTADLAVLVRMSIPF